MKEEAGDLASLCLKGNDEMVLTWLYVSRYHTFIGLLQTCPEMTFRPVVVAFVAASNTPRRCKAGGRAGAGLLQK